VVAATADASKTKAADNTVNATTKPHGRRITRGYQFFSGTHAETDH
jgi:hypothetical protein